MNTTATKTTVEYLGCTKHPDRTVHFLEVAGRGMWVRDTCDRFQRYEACSVDGDGIHKVFTRGGKAVDCDCKDRKYRKTVCRHMIATNEVLNRW